MWGLTRANIRYHLNELLHEGAIERVHTSIGGLASVGRPIQFYRLSTEEIPNNLPALCQALLSALEELNPGQTADEYLRAVAHAMVRKITNNQGEGANTSIVRRLGLAVRYLDIWKYRARWEAGASGPRILLRKCPYAVIINEHPELCQMDKFLLEKLTGLSLQQTTKMNLNTGKPPACLFAASAAELNTAMNNG